MSRSLLACGSNGAGQLALGHEEDVPMFTPCKFDPSCGQVTQIDDLVSAASHSLLLVTTSDGDRKLLGAGTNSHNQLGLQCALTDCQRAAPTFRPISLQRAAGLGDDWIPTKIAATWTTSFVLYSHPSTGEEKLVACGSNDFGELSVSPGSSDTIVVVNLGLRPDERVELLRGGQRHVIAVLSQNGSQRVVGWGAARRGELSAIPLPAAPRSAKGKGKAPARPSTLTPTAVDLVIPPGSRIVDISLGASHSLALLSSGRVLAWGNDAKGQITGLDTVTGVRQIGATWGGSYLLTDEGILSQGSNTHGQLLRDATDGDTHAPIPLEGTPTALCAGTEHLLVMARGTAPHMPESLHVGGWNEHGNLGLGDAVDRPRLVRIKNVHSKGERVVSMWAGCAASWIWLETAPDSNQTQEQ